MRIPKGGPHQQDRENTQIRSVAKRTPSTAVTVGGFDVLAPMVSSLLHKDVAIFDMLTRERGVATGSLIAVADEALELFGSPRS